MEAGPAKERDIPAVGAAEFEDPGGRQAAGEEVTQPMSATLRQIEAGAARDIGQTVVLGLALMPVIFRIKFTGVVLDRKRLGRKRGAANKCTASLADVIIGRICSERRMATPTYSAGGRGWSSAHA
jgi:hypothetical protein